MDKTELVQLRSAKMGYLRCPLKGEHSGVETIFKCKECEFHRGMYKLPLTVAVACAKKYSAWDNGISVFEYGMIASLPHP